MSNSLEGTYKERFLLHYNFPPYSVGETGRMGSPGPPRNRPWQARLARHPSDAAGGGGIPLYAARRLRDHRVERLIVDGDGLRLVARVDGRRRAAEARRPPASPWASSSKASASPCSPTFSATRIISATWTSRWRARPRASPRCRWTSRSPASPRRSCGSRSPRRETAVCTSSAKWPRRSPASRAELGEFAPRIETMKIPTDKIREVIGTGGKVIREIVEKTGAKINIEDDGTVKVASSRRQFDQGGDQLDQVDRLRSGSRPDLRRHGGEDRRFRRLREFLRRQGRPRPHLAALQGSA